MSGFITGALTAAGLIAVVNLAAWWLMLRAGRQVVRELDSVCGEDSLPDAPPFVDDNAEMRRGSLLSVWRNGSWVDRWIADPAEDIYRPSDGDQCEVCGCERLEPCPGGRKPPKREYQLGDDLG